MDTAGLRVMGGAAAALLGSRGLELEQEQELGRRGEGNSETAAAAAAAVEGQAEELLAGGLLTEDYNLLTKEEQNNHSNEEIKICVWFSSLRTLTRILHRILGGGTRLLRRVPPRSLVLLVHLA